MAEATPPILLLLAGEIARVRTGAGEQPLAPLDAALLAWLALEGPTARNRLAALLWPHKPDEAARNSLRQRLFQLRRQLGVDLVEGSSVLQLTPAVGHDLDGAGPLLGDAPLQLDGDFADWLARRRRERLDRQRAGLQAQAEQARQDARWPEALQHAQALLALDPLSEAAHRLLIQLHYLAGDRAAALQAFDRCERVLKDELGVRPSPATLELLALVDQATPPAVMAPTAAMPAAVLRPPRLVGRQAPWQGLHAAWSAGRSVWLLGEAGMGKSRLASDFAASIGRTPVVSARPGDAGVVYASASRLLRALPRDQLTALPDGVRQELARVLPELGPAPEPGGEAARVRFLNAMAAALDPAHTGWQGVVFDDLHFADTASVELLHHLCGGSGLRWLFTARLAELGEAARQLMAGGDDPALQLTLAPLTVDEVRELLDSLGIDALDPVAVAAAWHRHTGGNPMFLLETLKAWLARPPDSPAVAGPARLPASPGVTALIGRRIGQLSQAAVQLARCAAIATPDFSIELAASVLGVRTLDLADPWTELEAAQVLRDGAFAHDLIHDSARASVPEPVARQLHAEVAAFLQDRGAAAARVAAHWLAAGRDDQAVDALVRAADEADEALRQREALELRERASRLAERSGRRALAFALALQVHDAQAMIDRSLYTPERIARLESLADSGAELLQARHRRADMHLHRGEYESALAEAVALARRAADDGQAGPEADALALAAQAAIYLDRNADAVRYMRQGMAWVMAAGDARRRMEFCSALSMALDNTGELAEAEGFHRRAAEVALEQGWIAEAAQLASNHAIHLIDRGRRAEAFDRLIDALRLAASVDQALGVQWHAELTLFNVARDCGRFDRALDASQRVADLADQHPQAAPLHRIGEALLWLRLGQPARTRPLLGGLDPAGLRPLAAARRAQLLARLATRQRQGAVAAWAEARLRADECHAGLAALVRLEQALLGQPDAGLQACRDTLAQMEARGADGVALVARLFGCSLAQQLGEADLALQWARAAVATPAEIGPEDIDLAERWLRPARVLQALGHADEARAPVLAGATWVRTTAARLPTALQAAFVERVPANRELLVMAGGRLTLG